MDIPIPETPNILIKGVLTERLCLSLTQNLIVSITKYIYILVYHDERFHDVARCTLDSNLNVS